MRFCTVINCIDGRIQLPVINFLQVRFNAEFVDTITEAGPNLILAEQKNRTQIQSILERVRISIDNHNSVGIAIVGHHDCAGNPATKEMQLNHLHHAVQLIQEHFKHTEVIRLWVDEHLAVQEI